MNLYVGYPITRASFRRKLRRDAVGVSGWKNLQGLLQALPQPHGAPGRPPHRRPASSLVLVPLALIGRPELYLVPVAGAVDDRVAGASTGCGPSPSTAA